MGPAHQRDGGYSGASVATSDRKPLLTTLVSESLFSLEFNKMLDFLVIYFRNI